VSAFTLWAIVQLFPDWSAAAAVNDGTIIIFITDLALVLSPWRLALD
jgi:hypothetical protein